jgi:hypothetical protein
MPHGRQLRRDATRPSSVKAYVVPPLVHPRGQDLPPRGAANGDGRQRTPGVSSRLAHGEKGKSRAPHGAMMLPRRPAPAHVSGRATYQGSLCRKKAPTAGAIGRAGATFSASGAERDDLGNGWAVGRAGACTGPPPWDDPPVRMGDRTPWPDAARMREAPAVPLAGTRLADVRSGGAALAFSPKEQPAVASTSRRSATFLDEHQKRQAADRPPRVRRPHSMKDTVAL